MARYLENDYLAPSATTEDASAIAAEEAARAAAKTAYLNLPSNLQQVVQKGLSTNAFGPGLGANAASDEAAYTAAAVAAATPVDPKNYYTVTNEDGTTRPMTASEVAVEKAREAGVFYGSNNVGMTPANATKYAGATGPAINTPYVPSDKKAGMDDAYALLIMTFKRYGLEDLVPDIMTMMEKGMGAAEAGLNIRNLPRYKERFNGNELRIKAGLNVLSEDAYLALEDSYSETMRAYGLQSYFGTTARDRQAKMSQIIGADIAATEFKDRISTVVTRVENADPNIKETLKSFYNIGDTDLIGYFLNPKENLPKLQEKVTAAEIGSEFVKQGLTTGVTSAEEFAKLGIDKAAAAKGTQTIAGFLPEAKFLSTISPEENINYSQKTAEEEVLKGLDSARRKRVTLAEKEAARFSGSAGTSRVSFNSNTSF